MSERIIAVEDCSLKSYLGNYDFYKNEKDKLSIKESKEPAVKAQKVKKPKNNHEDSRKIEKDNTLIIGSLIGWKLRDFQKLARNL